MKLLVAVVSLAFAAAPAAGQASGETASVAVIGRVIQAGSETPLPGARLQAGSQEAYADAQGRFRLLLAPGRWEIAVTAEGHFPDTVTVRIEESGASELLILLAPDTFQETVLVAAPTEASTGPPPLPVRPVDVMSQAGVVDNIFRSLQTLAGVAAPNEFDSRLSVRGGGPDQNLTVMDGVEIHNPYRLFGLTSAFNPETVNEFELSTGAFSVRHGDRLSSLLQVDNRDGTQERSFGGSSSLSITDANLVLEGKLPGSAPGSWLVTGRRTYYDLVAESFVNEDLPSFGDLQTRLTRQLRGGGRLSLTGLLSRETTDAGFTDDNSPEFAEVLTRADNDLLALSFETPLGAGSSRTVASWYRFTDAIDFTGLFQSDGRSNASEPALRPDLIDVIFTRAVEIRDLALRQEFLTLAGTRHLLDYGFEIHDLDTRWGWDIPAGRNPNEANGSSVQGGTGLPELLDSRVASTRLGAWLSDRFQVTPALTLEPGVRIDRSTVNDRTVVSPRLAARFELDSSTRVRGALGLHSQSPGYEKTFQNDYFVDLSDASGLATERSTHVILGVERDLARGVQLRLEGYYKDFDDLIVGRLESEPERLARVARYDFPPELAGSIPSEAQITSLPSNGSRGRAYGLDLFLQKRATSADTRLEGWIAYTWGRADRDAYGRRYPFDYDRRHSLNAVGALRLSSKLELAVTGRFATGFAYTPPRGLRIASVEDSEDPESLVPKRDAEGNLVYQIDPGDSSTLNGGRLPFFARVDARVTFRPRGLSGRWLFYLEVINVFDRQNTASFDYDIRFDPATGEPRLSQGNSEGSIPLLPTIGVRFRF